jgi:hypothetical protein
MTNKASYILCQDDDCNWYMVPEEKLIEFNEWADAMTAYNPFREGLKSPALPESVTSIDGPHSIKIHSYTEN